MNCIQKYCTVVLCFLANTTASAQFDKVQEKKETVQVSDSTKPKPFPFGMTGPFSANKHARDSSIRVLTQIQTQKTTLIRTNLTSRIDSLSKLPNPDKKLIESLTVYRNRLDSLHPPGVGSVVGAGQSSKEEVDQALTGIEGKVNEKLGLFSGNGANVPGPLSLGVPNVSTPGLSGMASPSSSGIPQLHPLR